jgi:hypothetical protein
LKRFFSPAYPEAAVKRVRATRGRSFRMRMWE